MVALTAVEEKWTTRTADGVSSRRDTAEVQLTEGLTLTVSSVQPDKALSVKLAAKNWVVKHSVHEASHRQDTRFKARKLVKDCLVTVSQHIPDQKWFLLPTPAVKVVKKFREGADVLKAKYNFERQQGKLTQTLYTGFDRQYKASLHLDSVKGSSIAARAKVKTRAVYSVAAATSKQGSVLSCKSRPFDRCKTLTQLHLPQQLLTLTATYIPKVGETQNRTKLTLHAGFLLRDEKIKPTVSVGCKWLF
ncbi:hypothetical protein WJX72_003611 [[Myrmecia] bisecta]|uniref:Uncharacterized protein n=1 Tax=[Myrmecia] bisecta TaxID=41462 RepID=A0AAW1PTG2_9CHLO